MGANDDEQHWWLGADQGADPRRGGAERADARHLPRPPAGRRGARRRSRPATRAASRSGCSTSAGPTRPRTTRCSARSAAPRAAACSGTTTSSTRCPRARPCSPRPRTARSRRRASARRMWGVQLHPEVDETIVGTWVTDDERTELADRGLDADGILAEIEAARAELDEAWQPLAAGFADWRSARRRAAPRPAMSRPASAQGNLTRLGFLDPEAAAARPGRARGRAPNRWSRCWPAPPTRTRRSPSWSGWPRRRPTAAPMLRALVDDEGTAMRLLSRARRQRGAGRPPVPAPRALARADRPDARARPAPRRTPCARRCSRPSAPTRTPTRRPRRCRTREAVDALRVEYRRVLLRLASRDLTHHLGVDDAAAELSDLAAGTLDAALAVARQRVGRVAAAGAAGGRRDGQVRRPRAQLRLRRRRDLRLRAGRRAPTTTAALRAATQLASHLMRVCSEQTGEGTIWPVDAALRPEGKAGPLVRTLASHRGYYERWASTWEFQALLKARAGRRRPRAGPASTSRWSSRWSGAPPSGTGSSPTPRRCAAGSSSTSRPTRPSGSSSSARAGCATSSSPSSCSSSCTAAPTRGSGRRPR